MVGRTNIRYKIKIITVYFFFFLAAVFIMTKNKTDLKAMRQGIGVIIVLGMIAVVDGLTAYDCTHPNATQTPLSLLKPKSCVAPQEYYQDAATIRIQLIQTSSARPVEAFTCRLTVTSKVTKCGFDSITYGSHFPIKDQMVDIAPQTCREAVKTGKMVYEGQKVKITPDTSRTFQYYRRGLIKTNGACTTESFNIAGIYFSGSVELRTLRVSISTTRGVVNNAGTAVFVNGLRGVYKDSIIRDSKVGTMVWTIEDAKCHEHISEIYLGEANIFRSTQNRSIDSIIILSNNKTNQYGGFLLKGSQSLCRNHVYTTQIPNLVIHTMRSGDAPIAHSVFKVKDLIVKYIDTVFL